MKIKIRMFSLLMFVIAFGSVFAEIQTIRAFEKMCCRLPDGSCGAALANATTCALGTAVECASCSVAATNNTTNTTNTLKSAHTPISGQVLDAGTVTATGNTEFNNPLQFNSVEGFLSHFLTVLQRIIVVLSLVFIVIGAVMYIISAGNSGMVEKAKTAITSSLIGLALGIAAPSFLKEISLVLGWGGPTTPEVQAALTLTEIALKVLNFLLSMVGILAVLMLVVGGVMYLSSAGNEDRIDSGKNIVKNAIIGIIISLSAMVLVRQIAQFFAQ